jgi:hypothetical protein
MAVMASEAPIDNMAFNEKAHLPQTDVLSVDAKMNG